MTNYFVSRHQGAINWARGQGIEAVFVEHIEPQEVSAGDIVLGSLPVSKIAALNEKGVRYLHLELNLTRQDRGRELTVEDMNRLDARLVEYRVEKVEGGV